MNHLENIIHLYPNFIKKEELPFLIPMDINIYPYSAGDILLGYIYPSREPVRIFLDSRGNIIISGSPRFGKTNLLTYIIIQCLIKESPVLWIFDPKRDYECLQKFFPNIVILDVKNIIDNPLNPPPGVSRDIWIDYFIEFLASDLSGLILVKSVFHELISELFLKTTAPTIRSLYEYSNKKYYPRFQRRSQVLDSIKARLSMLNKFFGDQFDVEKGFLNNLITKNVVFVMTGIYSSELVNFLIHYLSFYLFTLKLHNNIKEIHHVLVIDEAKRIMDKSMDSTLEGSVSPFSYLLSQSLEFKLSFIAVTQEYSRLSNALKSSSNISIAFNSHSHKDLIEASTSIGLKKEEYEILKILPPGCSYLKKESLPPVIIQTPYIPIKELA